MPTAKYKIERRCEVCGKVFLAPTLDSKYCCSNCGKTAYRIRKKEERKLAKMKEIVDRIDEDREYISVKEAISMFNVAKTSIYRYIRSGRVHCINLGERMMRIDLKELEECFLKRPFDEKNIKPLPTLYNMEPEHCYTIGEIAKKFKIDECTVYLHIRKYSIPTRQIGNYVYAPKVEIDTLYKDIVK